MENKKISNLFLSIGMMKTGTTWLYSVLDNHPDIYFSYEKEIHYFAHRYTSETPLNNAMRLKRTINAIERDKNISFNPKDLRQKLLWYSDYIDEPINDHWYLNLFRFKGTERYCSDFSNLTCHVEKKGWEAIKNITDNLKVILILRHPLQRLFSHLNFHLMFINKHNEISKWSKSDYINFCNKGYIWKNSVYSEVVEKLKKYLNNEQYKIYFYEEIIKDRKKFLKNIENFLEIQTINYPEHIVEKKVNVTKKTSKPQFFNDLFRKKFVADVKKLYEMGLILPKEWSDLY